MTDTIADLPELKRLYELAEERRQVWFDVSDFLNHLAGQAYAAHRDEIAAERRILAKACAESAGFPRSQGYWLSITEDLWDRIQRLEQEEAVK